MNSPQLPLDPEQTVYLRDGWRVPRALYLAVRDAALRTLPNLREDLLFKAEHVCGPNFWVTLTPAEAKLAGRCLVQLVHEGEVPLEFATPKGTCLRYQRR